MSTVFSDVPPTQWTLADVQSHLPGFPPNRIRSYPSPGMATEQDVLEAEARTGRICELIDGTLVEKTMATLESMLAIELAYFIRRHLETDNLGIVLGGDGLLRILPGQIRAPDVSFVRWERFAGGKLPKAAIFAVAPDLAAEILSDGNTPQEMTRKLHDYFQVGGRLVWFIDPRTRTARVYTGERTWTEVASDGLLVGGDVLPGFELRLADLFARAEGPARE